MGTLTETFDDPLSGWRSRWLYTNSNLRNYYVQYNVVRWFGCWSGPLNEDCRGNNWDGIWIADQDNSNSNPHIRFNAAFAATVTSLSLDIGAHFIGTLTVYDKDGAVILSQPIPYGCSSCSNHNPGGNVYSHHTVLSSNGVSGFDITGPGYIPVEGSVGIDNVTVTVVPSDETPPSITPTVTGVLGSNGWYTDDVTVAWSVTDGESAVSSTTGCGPTTINADTPGTTLTCSATSDGGSASESVSITRDATAPAITFAGNAGSYTVDQTVAITCSAADGTSGVASTSCPSVASGPAYTFALGSNSASATASDNAGNATTESTTFTVAVTYGSLCALTQSFVSNAGIANALCQKLNAAAASAARGNAESKAGQLGAYVNQLNAQSGKSITAANAAILIGLAGSL